MKRFKNNQRIVVRSGHSSIIGKCGTVVRMRFADDQAWVKMDERPHGDVCFFPADDERSHHILLDPANCEAA